MSYSAHTGFRITGLDQPASLVYRRVARSGYPIWHPINHNLSLQRDRRVKRRTLSALHLLDYRNVSLQRLQIRKSRLRTRQNYKRKNTLEMSRYTPAVGSIISEHPWRSQ